MSLFESDDCVASVVHPIAVNYDSQPKGTAAISIVTQFFITILSERQPVELLLGIEPRTTHT